MNKLEQAARHLLEVADGIQHGTDWNNGTHAKIYRPKFPAAITALREALAEQAEQEPVLMPVRRGTRITCMESDETCVVWTTSDTHAWVQFPDGQMGKYTYEQIGSYFSLDENYATDEAYERGLKEGIEAGKKIAAPVRTKDLTDDEIKQVWLDRRRELGEIGFARAIEAKIKEKNHA